MNDVSDILSVGDVVATRTEKRSVATKRKLLKAARSVFAEKGFDLARIDDITERADVGKGTFYNYFADKDEVMNELVIYIMKDLTKSLKESCRGITDLTQLMDSIIATHIVFFSSRWEDFVLFFQGRISLTLEKENEAIQAPYNDYLARIEKLISGVMHQGLPHNMLRRIACAVAGMVSGYYSFAVVSSDDDDVDAVFKSLKGAMVASLVRFINEAVKLPGKE